MQLKPASLMCEQNNVSEEIPTEIVLINLCLLEWPVKSTDTSATIDVRRRLHSLSECMYNYVTTLL